MRAIKNITLKFKSSKRILTESVKIITLCFGISTLCSTHASALSAQEEVDVQFIFVPSLSIMLSDNILHIDDLTPGNYASSNTICINVTTNSAFGYTLTATIGDEEDYTSNELINTDAEAVFSSIGSNAELTLSNFSPNYWGYTTATSVGGSSLYSGLVYDASTVINKTMDPSGRAFREYPGTNTTNFTIGASASSDQFSGDYTNVIGFELIANVDTDVYTYMQDITKAQLAALLPNTGDTMILADKRDYTEYLVGRLADDNFWMLQNLALDPETTAAVLSSENTNMPENDAAEFGTVFGSMTSTSSGFSSFVVPMINNSIKNSTKKLAVGQNGNNTVGVFYNYCAASAGTYCYDSSGWDGDAQYDICPKGWRLPTGGASGEFKALREQYSSDGDFILALRVALSGNYLDNGAQYVNQVGYAWSSTRRNAIYMYRFNADTTDIYLNHVDYRGYGFPIRCIKADD